MVTPPLCARSAPQLVQPIISSMLESPNNCAFCATTSNEGGFAKLACKGFAIRYQFELTVELHNITFGIIREKQSLVLYLPAATIRLYIFFVIMLFLDRICLLTHNQAQEQLSNRGDPHRAPVPVGM